MNEESIELFKNKVVEFNRIANDGANDVSDEAITRQLKFCKEEYKELIHEMRCGDNKKQKKELADCFVVFSYLYWLFEQKYPDVLPSGDLELDSALLTLDALLIDLFEEYLTDGDMEAVIQSNLSKFPLLSEIESPEKEAKRIEECSEGRYNNVYYIIVKDDAGECRYVFKDGNRKILKPITYKEPILN